MLAASKARLILYSVHTKSILPSYKPGCTYMFIYSTVVAIYVVCNNLTPYLHIFDSFCFWIHLINSPVFLCLLRYIYI